MNKYVVIVSILIVASAVGGFVVYTNSVNDEDNQGHSNNENPTQKYKILHIMSYHSPWKWTDDQFDGFKDVLKDLDVEYKVFQMDTKRNSSDEWKEEAGRQARELIDTWEPDLVYTNDDNAQIYVTKYYINSSIPFVFSGVNAEPETYGFVGSTNIAGVLERPHFVETVGLLDEITPDINKIAVISDDGPTWPPLIESMKEDADSELLETEFISWDVVETFDEYKQKVNEYQTKADAICHLGTFTFKDENGTNVPYEDVMRWTVENSNLPDFSFWSDRVDMGNLAAMTVSGYEQGKSAGEITYGILVDGKSPSSFGFEPTVKGEPVVSFARANKLDVQIPSEILLTASVIETFAWEE